MGELDKLTIVVDLRNSTVNGRRVMPRVAELVYCLVEFPDIDTPTLIDKLFGAFGPENARNALKQTAYQARKVGIDVEAYGSGQSSKYTIARIREIG